MKEEERGESWNMSNDGYTAAGVIQIRLDMGPELDQIEAFLRGRRIVGYEEGSNGALLPKIVNYGSPKMNEEGVQTLMSWLTGHFSPSTVQGNFDEDRYDDYIFELDVQTRVMIATNRAKWGIKIEDFISIGDFIMLKARPFFSRLINNKERESYAQTMRSVESNSVKSGAGLMSIFKS